MNPTHGNHEKGKTATPPPAPAAKAVDASKTPSDGKPNPGTAAPDAKVHGSLDAKAEDKKDAKAEESKAEDKKDAKAEDKKDAKADESDGDGDGATEGAKKRTVARRVYIVVGEIREFENAAAAEKFLNNDLSAPVDYSVIKGLKVNRKNKVSLR